METLITIFTPTYNRAHTLSRLYDSLINQTYKNFEWVIVDDGSTDNTKEIVESFKKEAQFPITYLRKENEGKHIAINKGVELAKGDLFFIVDSDDYLIPTATEIIARNYPLIKDRPEMAGISFRRGYSEKKYIGSQITFSPIEANALDFRNKYKIKGDMAEVFKTSILKNYPFPFVEGEKFCAEGLVWNRIALKYKLIWFSKIIYICEYLEGGLTDNSFKIRKNSPITTTNYYSELAKMDIPFLQKIKANINYWRFARFLEIPFMEKWKRMNPVLSLIGFPLSLILQFKDKT